MSDKNVRQWAVSIALVIFSLFSGLADDMAMVIRWVAPGLGISTADSSIYERILSGAFGGVKLAVLILGLERIFFSIAARKFLGRWVYESSSGNCAILDISVSGFWAGGVGLNYAVSIYAKPHEVVWALTNKTYIEPRATAHGLFTQLTSEGLVVMYEVHRGRNADWDWDALRGYLRLKTTAQKNVLFGYWESTRVNNNPNIPDSEVRTGDYKAVRPKHFRKKYEQT